MVSRLKCFKKISLFLTLVVAFAAVNVSAATPFSKIKITLGSKDLTVELAETPDQHERGLMFREKMGTDEGMLFIFKNAETRFFWMKNTLIDLSIGYFDASGTLIDIQEMKSGKGVTSDTLLPSYPSSSPAKYALEMNKGWFDKNKVKIGTKLKVHR